MRVLITGGSGFIGRNLVERFTGAHEVFAPTHAELDLTDERAVAEWFDQHEIDVVVHAAVRPGHRAAADPSRQLWNNLRMFLSIVSNGHKFGRLIFLSSGAVYDTRRSLVRVPEHAFGERMPADEHGFSKYVIAKLLQDRHSGARPRAIELRLFGVFGEHEDYSIRFISNAICRALHDLPITLNQNRRFSYLFVEDLARVVEWSMTAESSAVAYNVVPRWTDDLYDLALLVSQCSGKDVPVVVANPRMGSEYSGDGSLLQKDMPEMTFTPTASAVVRLFDWYVARAATIDRARLMAHE